MISRVFDVMSCDSDARFLAIPHIHFESTRKMQWIGIPNSV